MKRTVSFILIQAAIVAALFGILELVLRNQDFVISDYVYARYYSDLAGDFEPNASIVSHHPREYPYRFTTNSQGLRSVREIDKTKPADVIRILCLGDSFTLGWGVQDDQTFPELLYQLLRRKYPDKKFEVINTGLMYSNVLDQISYYNDKGKYLNSDIVISQYCYNDVVTDMFRPFVGRQAMSLENGKPYHSGLIGMLRTKILNSAVFKTAAYIHSKYTNVDDFNKKFLLHPKKIPQPDELNSLLVTPNAEEKEVTDKWFAFTDEKNIHKIERIWNKYLQGVLLLKNKIESDGAQFIFLSIPSQNELDEYKNAESCVFSAFAREHNVNYLDLTPEFRSRVDKSTKELLLVNDGHTSPLGNAVVAESLARSIDISDTIRISTPPPLIDCSTKTTFRLQYDEMSGLALVAEPSTSSIRSTIATEGLEIDSQDPKTVTVGTGSGTGSIGKNGYLSIRLHSTRPILLFDVVCIRRNFNNGISDISLVDGDTGDVYWNYSADSGNYWDGMENIKIFRKIIYPGFTDIHLRLEFKGSSQIVFSTGENSRDRMFEIHCFSRK